ncbi:glycosyltransferase family 4 protein [Clostridium beijerinckii]|nr:glycosyltransferase family 4 protein [Clostridium beijerinckii]MBC2423282.1 glycosyltransferase family 4 protein [Clostridium beijerinckii]MBC2431709.1 glycosyltransferase family 4 protein [Clostridium beijerinckii]MBC2489583.1 glycosyltransferase family 4 protein [Clostridium beijerinckii]MBC2523270.1 glycosyltransferase family 4 protein [Clostridium beijerinckii]
MKDRKKIAFFVKQGMDSFLGEIISRLEDEYETKKIIVTDYKQIDKGLEWADICWFEWCDELITYGSRHHLSENKKIICRLHSYEAFAKYIDNVKWDNVDRIIFVGENIKRFVIDRYKIDERKMVIIPNGVNIDEYTFKERKSGFNIAYVGYINYKKGPMLLLHTFKAIYDKDHRYKLYIAGQFQDDRDVLYFQQMIKEFGIEKNVCYEGWQDNLDKWLEDKNYILCTSILESQNMSVMQAMAKGIKPIIHNFVGAKGIYNNNYIWNTIDEAVEIINDKEYSSQEYRKFIKENYSLESQIKSLKQLLGEFLSNRSDKETSHKKQIELDDINEVVSIYFYGRSGSIFLQSLLDSHPNILMIPGDYIRFYYAFWNYLDPKLNYKVDKDVIINTFNEVFPFIFDANNVSKTFVNSGYGGDFGIRLGFNAMGENQNQKLGISKEKFVSELNRIFKDRKYIARKDFFKAIHIAYFYSLGRKYDSNRQPIIVFFPHIANVDASIELLEDFPQTKRICMIREPIQSLGSLINTYRRVCNISIEQMIYILNPSLYGGTSTNLDKYLSCAVKLEDIHMKSKETLEKICRFIDIPWSDSLMESTFDGLKWWNGKNSDRINGFNTKVINRKHKELFTDFDRKRLKSLIYRKYEEWEYEVVKMDYNELNRELDKPFKFEEYICYSNNYEREKGRISIRNLFKQYWKDVNSNIIAKEVKLLK